MSDISLYYGLNPYYSNTFTNANGKIRNLVWEELVDPVGGKFFNANPLLFTFMQDYCFFQFKITVFQYHPVKAQLATLTPVKTGVKHGREIQQPFIITEFKLGHCQLVSNTENSVFLQPMLMLKTMNSKSPRVELTA